MKKIFTPKYADAWMSEYHLQFLSTNVTGAESKFKINALFKVTVLRWKFFFCGSDFDFYPLGCYLSKIKFFFKGAVPLFQHASEFMKIFDYEIVDFSDHGRQQLSLYSSFCVNVIDIPYGAVQFPYLFLIDKR
jgi:hypothetical protein